ncbi:MAG: flagellin B, partial [Epsilonproteobacteria bacterium]|nr:flagellin B [Campylobacterota bacterium]
KAADDASGLAIANQLKAQATGLGQAIRNANDGINMAQTADGALNEYGNIVNTIRTKSIQAASDGQNADSRKAIQRDINKLMEEAQNIASTTSFNGQNLLDGTFQNKNFQIGAYANQTVGISIASAQTNSIGAHVDETGTAVALTAALTGGSISTSLTVTINSVDIGATAADSSSGANATAHSATSAWAVAQAINGVTNKTGVTATANTAVTGAAVAGGSISAGSLTINGIDIGAVSVSANDSDSALMNAINALSNQTNVIASHDGGKMVLTATDGSDIAIGGIDTSAKTGITTAATTQGKITLTSDNAVTVTDTSTGIGFTASKTISTSKTLNSIDVTTRDSAESAIKTTDSALRQIDTIRSGIGSVQNQLESTVRNISVTQVNVTSAESSIRDVDFAQESANFSKFNILAQSGSYAMSQANAVQQNVLRLLQ